MPCLHCVFIPWLFSSFVVPCTDFALCLPSGCVCGLLLLCCGALSLCSCCDFSVLALVDGCSHCPVLAENCCPGVRKCPCPNLYFLVSFARVGTAYFSGRFPAAHTPLLIPFLSEHCSRFGLQRPSLTSLIDSISL